MRFDWRTKAPKGWWRRRPLAYWHISNLCWIAVAAAAWKFLGLWELAAFLAVLFGGCAVALLALAVARRVR